MQTTNPDPQSRGPFDEVDTAVQPAHASGGAGSAFIVTVEQGPDTPAALRVDVAAPAPLLVGSSEVCDFRIQDPGVSRRHLALESSELGLSLRDLGSTNGTRVNGARVLDAILEGGERVELGGTTLRVERDVVRPPAELSRETHFGRVFGASARMRRLYPLFLRLAQASIPVIIEGETGTGKEALAEALHQNSPRAEGPFVVFDCTAASATLLESELFGHERGAFTGAVGTHRGVFQQAHGGTLLIDEIGDLDLGLQPKLLRAIERSEVRPLGSTRSIRVDVRVLAATRRDLDREVQEGRFRDDLFHRLAVARVELPPLRGRQGDITLLARHFWSELSGDGGGTQQPSEPPLELLRRWERDPWPGNVRQLRNAVARSLALGELEAARADPAAPSSGDPAQDFIEQIVRQRLALPIARERVVHEFERRYLEDALSRHGRNVTRAAKESGIALRYFQLLRQRRGSEPGG